ncbi:ubiquitin carboxyl-terminal hydrolase [Histoplasma capsulatum var. duboisii H88]|uniref:ubiquitinyl hydrolase 1 n=1 Tax=Ajellomyces capsulatus (strain H88) TaxID=544711 RepID=A0A8A1LAJ0_AJEC8|nr:ubiquitin carboxyl-terminal hydrolase [Histoplasma capsulatum var. duboisii H88]
MSDAEFGCEHLRDVLEKDEKTASQFHHALLQAHQGAPPKPAEIKSLKPFYPCLECSTDCTLVSRYTHFQNSGHKFFTDSRTGTIFCLGCDDYVYDAELESFLFDPSVLKKRKLDSGNDDDQAYVIANANKRVCGKEGVRGLFNLGQTCYMNVILQTLLHDPLLTTYFLGNNHHTYDCTIQNCISCAVSEAFAEFNNDDKTEGFGALNLLLASWRSSPMLSGYQQQDAHEFYQFLVDKLHAGAHDHVEDHNKTCHCFFHNAFYGKLRSSVTCDKCGNVTQTEDQMIDLSLDVQVQKKKRALGGGESTAAPTLDGCLQSFTSPEKLMADAYNCSGCGSTQQKATKQLRIRKLPVILCMQLKRFEHTLSVSEKVEGKIDFPLSINMLPYTTRAHYKNEGGHSNFLYDLSSAVVHKGKLDAGHYYVYCRQGEQWYLFNDDQVTVVNEAEVLAADAYLLFYTLHALSGAS